MRHNESQTSMQHSATITSDQNEMQMFADKTRPSLFLYENFRFIWQKIVGDVKGGIE